MGQPASGGTEAPSRATRGRAPGELKHLSTPRKRNQRDSVSSGERTRRSPNLTYSVAGKPMYVGGCTHRREAFAGASGSDQASFQANGLGRPARGGESPVAGGNWPSRDGGVSTAGHEKPRGKLGRPRSKAQYRTRPIADKYREGTVKRPPARGVKQT